MLITSDLSTFHPLFATLRPQPLAASLSGNRQRRQVINTGPDLSTRFPHTYPPSGQIGYPHFPHPYYDDYYAEILFQDS